MQVGVGRSAASFASSTPRRAAHAGVFAASAPAGERLAAVPTGRSDTPVRRVEATHQSDGSKRHLLQCVEVCHECRWRRHDFRPRTMITAETLHIARRACPAHLYRATGALQWRDTGVNEGGAYSVWWSVKPVSTAGAGGLGARWVARCCRRSPVGIRSGGVPGVGVARHRGGRGLLPTPTCELSALSDNPVGDRCPAVS